MTGPRQRPCCPVRRAEDRIITRSIAPSARGRLWFHSAIEIGYRFTPDLSGSVYFEHSSNAGLARYNDGLDNLGLRVGIRF